MIVFYDHFTAGKAHKLNFKQNRIRSTDLFCSQLEVRKKVKNLKVEAFLISFGNIISPV